MVQAIRSARVSLSRVAQRLRGKPDPTLSMTAAFAAFMPPPADLGAARHTPLREPVDPDTARLPPNRP